MNKVILLGRLTKEPTLRYTGGPDSMAVARFTLAINRRVKRENEQQADFINCIAFGKTAEIAEQYCHKGIKLAVEGRIQTGSYTDRGGIKIYTTDVIIENLEFAESRKAAGNSSNNKAGSSENNSNKMSGTYTDSDGFIHIPDGVEDEGLPFS